MDSNSLDRTARWVQTHAVRPHTSRHHSSPSHSRSASTRHNQGVSGAGFVSQHSSQTDLDAAEQPVTASYPSHSKHHYSSRSNEQETHSRSKHSHGSRHRNDYDSQRSKEKYDERGSTARQRHFPPRLNIPDELYRNPNLPAFVQGPPGSGYPVNMTTIRTPLPTTPTRVHSERAAVREPPSPPFKISAQLNPKVRSDPFRFILHVLMLRSHSCHR
jgi:hypothetical protein